MSEVPFVTVGQKVDEFLTLLTDLGIEIPVGTQTENDALAIMQVLDYWRYPEKRPDGLDGRGIIRSAVGFVDIACKVLNVRDKRDFKELIPHLRLIASGSLLQNRGSSVVDSVANKMIEMYFGALAMECGEDVKVDDPYAAKGDNPDVMLTFRGQKWAIALKTLHSTAPRTIYDNIKKGADQIEASDAQYGLVALNLKNVLNHDALWPPGDTCTFEASAKVAIVSQTLAVIGKLDELTVDDWKAAFGGGRKAQIPVLFVSHGVSYAIPSFGGGPKPMPIKLVMAHPEPENDPVGAMKLARSLTHFMQSLI